MKKILIASTALVATAGVAAAEVTFDGYGRFGILYEEDRGGVDAVTGEALQEETRFESRFRLNIVGATETDNGVRFAALMRIEANDNARSTLTPNEVQSGALSGARFQASAGGFRVQAGNISGVTDAAEVVNYFGIEPGLIGQIGQYSTHGVPTLDAFSSRGAGVNGLSAKYEVGDFAVHASYTPDHDSNAPAGDTGDRESFEIGASYTFSGWTLGGSYGDYSDDQNAANDFDFWTLTLGGTIGVADLVLFLGDTDVTGDDLAYGISGSIPVGAATAITASYAGGGADGLDDAYGIGFTHSLGGGVTLSGLVGKNTDDNTVADLGVRFNF